MIVRMIPTVMALAVFVMVMVMGAPMVARIVEVMP